MPPGPFCFAIESQPSAAVVDYELLSCDLEAFASVLLAILSIFRSGADGLAVGTGNPPTCQNF